MPFASFLFLHLNNAIITLLGEMIFVELIQAFLVVTVVIK